MDWVYSWFYAPTPVTVAPTIEVAPPVTDVGTSTEVVVTVPTIVVAVSDTESLPPLIPVEIIPDPDEFSKEPDSRYQYKTRQNLEYEKRCQKKKRNKARRNHR